MNRTYDRAEILKNMKSNLVILSDNSPKRVKSKAHSDNQTPKRPINLNPNEKKSGYSGFVILRLSPNIPSMEGDDLVEVARTHSLHGLVHLCDARKQVRSRRLVRSLSPKDILKHETNAKKSNYPPLHSLMSYWRLDCRSLPETEIEEFVKRLNELSEVDLAYRETIVSDPVHPITNPLAVQQGYLDAAPIGMDVRWAWKQHNGDGAGVGFIDLEQGWNQNHEDLIDKTPNLIFGDNHDGVGGYVGDHGTAVLGEVVAVDNSVGGVGIAANCTSVRMVSHYDRATDTALHVAEAIAAATAAMSPGDVLQLEVQRDSLLLPTETDPADFDAIRLAVANGIIVVEAGGNGDNDLDSWTDTMGNTMLNRGSPQFRDSGAIMVGAAISTVPHDRASFSNYGSRIDCYGWGEDIVTCGYGDLSPPAAPANQKYTAQFGGTSGATPMISGAGILLQGMYQARAGTRLTPGEMRILLSNPTTGTPQGGGATGHIAVMPNMRAIIENLWKCAFIILRNPLSQDEMDARRGEPGSSGRAIVDDAFRVVVDGFNAAALGVTDRYSNLNVLISDGTGLTIIPNGNMSDNGDYGPEAQRFTFFYKLDFGPTDDAFNFAGDTKTLTLTTSIASVSTLAQIDLIKQPDPFMLHGDPPWLSVDLRVFVVRAGEPKFGVTMGADASAAPAFIQQVMAALTSGNGTSGGETFDSLPTDESAKLFIQPTDNNGANVFNFALAKVHYIGLIGATNVRVFFRMFQAQHTYIVFDPTTTYRRSMSNPSSQPVPLAGIHGNEYVTIPCFAEQRVNSTVVGMDQQTDDSNRQNFTAIGGAEVDRYFGCWLDTNQPFKVDGVTPNNVLPVNVPSSNFDGPFTDPSNPPLTIQQAIIRNPHQCLIAEIAFDPVAIPVGKDPSNWDKLAQRNIAWSDIGSAQALTTLEIRPTPTGLPADQTPDELMIDWGDIPNGSMATIYLPAVNANDVLAMAAKMYTSHRLIHVDDHTLECRTGGITYVPIPPSGGVNYSGLLSVDLPDKVRKNQVFDVVVRQVTNAFGEYVPPPPPPPSITAHERQRSKRDIIEWRRVLGAFQLTIPVKAKEQLLVTEQRDLSVLRWIAETIPPHNRWYPVFSRYLEQIAGRVSAFGGDPKIIGPSPTGDWRKPKPKPPREREEERIAFTGKIAGLMFDRFGDFEGLLLDTEDGERKFFSREKEVEELAERAWRERLRITVWAERLEPHRPLTIIIREPPASFHG